MASSATAVAAPLQGLKSTAGLPVARRSTNGFGNVSNGARIRCMQYYPLLMLSCNTTMQGHVWPIEGIKKFETYLPPLSTDELLKQIDYLLRSNWLPCLKVGFMYRENAWSPGYNDGRHHKRYSTF
ncbi:ribulose bisphosphate carboxylase small subunit, chloroplastic 2-like [Miscanthus floridulus]|uniref:ribulose bisphosphate carboxylase small subunit, chloroplastic 2-like n=1 Tax=Miscanthus floridulus TaxID=154761 RepID=UPI0034577DC0